MTEKVCHYCKYPILWSDRKAQDDDGNLYHGDCADKLKTRWDDRRPERLAEESDGT